MLYRITNMLLTGIAYLHVLTWLGLGATDVTTFYLPVGSF